jgi:hypothetical protein
MYLEEKLDFEDFLQRNGREGTERGTQVKRQAQALGGLDTDQHRVYDEYFFQNRVVADCA